MRKSVIIKKNIKKTLQSPLKNINTRNLFGSYKKHYSSSKKKFFSISSKEDILKNNTKYTINNEPKLLKTINTKGLNSRTKNFFKNEKYLSAYIPKYKNFNTIKQSNNNIKNKKNNFEK